MHIHSWAVCLFVFLPVFCAGAKGETTLSQSSDTTAAAPAASGAVAQIASASQVKAMTPANEAFMGPFKLESGTYAVFHTTEGDFIARLFDKEMPRTVANFTGLATGRKKWVHPVTMAQNTRALYNNTAIYQAIKDIFIKGGDPTDTGRHGANHLLELESPEAFNFNSPGMLAMERIGKNSDGSRWIITLSPLPEWNGRYAIFGQVIGGLDVVRAISRKPSRKPSLPLEPVVVNTIEIVQVPAGGQSTATFSVEEGRKMLTMDKETARESLQTTASQDMPTTSAPGSSARTARTE